MLTLLFNKYLGTNCITRVFIKMLTKNIKDRFPFLSVIRYGGKEYVGIVINQDQWITSIYDYGTLKTSSEKQRLLELGETWWYESNRMIPINIFLKKELENYEYCMITMNSKNVEILLGPTVNVNNLATKRIKHKSVQLLRRPSN